MTIAISGSIAYDHIMCFDGNFADHILPENIKHLSVSFITPYLRRDFGGCAGNIAYNLRLLGIDAMPISSVGNDFAEYRAWMYENGISLQGIGVVREAYTAQSFIISDRNGAQFTGFHPGAMSYAHKQLFPENSSFISLGIIAPNGQAMVPHSQAMRARHIPYIFDPGQALTALSKEDCELLIKHADWIIVNAYEHDLLRKITGKTTQELAANKRALIITHGAQGAELFEQTKHFHVAAARVEQAVDNTGCGDAFRAGIVYGIRHQLQWRQSLQMACVMGAYAVEQSGCQSHRFNREEFCQRYQSNYQERCPLNTPIAPATEKK